MDYIILELILVISVLLNILFGNLWVIEKKRHSQLESEAIYWLCRKHREGAKENSK